MLELSIRRPKDLDPEVEQLLSNRDAKIQLLQEQVNALQKKRLPPQRPPSNIPLNSPHDVKFKYYLYPERLRFIFHINFLLMIAFSAFVKLTSRVQDVPDPLNDQRFGGLPFISNLWKGVSNPARPLTALVFPFVELPMLLYVAFHWIRVYSRRKHGGELGHVSEGCFWFTTITAPLQVFCCACTRMMFVIDKPSDFGDPNHKGAFTLMLPWFGFQLFLVVTAVQSHWFLVDTIKIKNGKYIKGRYLKQMGNVYIVALIGISIARWAGLAISFTRNTPIPDGLAVDIVWLILALWVPLALAGIGRDKEPISAELSIEPQYVRMVVERSRKSRVVFTGPEHPRGEEIEGLLTDKSKVENENKNDDDDHDHDNDAVDDDNDDDEKGKGKGKKEKEGEKKEKKKQRWHDEEHLKSPSSASSSSSSSASASSSSSSSSSSSASSSPASPARPLASTNTIISSPPLPTLSPTITSTSSSEVAEVIIIPPPSTNAQSAVPPTTTTTTIPLGNMELVIPSSGEVGIAVVTTTTTTSSTTTTRPTTLTIPIGTLSSTSTTQSSSSVLRTSNPQQQHSNNNSMVIGPDLNLNVMMLENPNPRQSAFLGDGDVIVTTDGRNNTIVEQKELEQVTVVNKKAHKGKLVVVESDYFTLAVNPEIVRVIAYLAFWFMVGCAMLFTQELVHFDLENSALIHVFGYNNICIYWDYEPARTLTALLYPPAEYFFAFYSLLCWLRAYFAYRSGQFQMHQFVWCSCSFMVIFLTLIYFRMIFVIRPDLNMTGHSIGFVGLQITLCLVSIQNHIFLGATAHHTRNERMKRKIGRWEHIQFLVFDNTIARTLFILCLILATFFKMYMAISAMAKWRCAAPGCASVEFSKAMDIIWLVLAAVCPVYISWVSRLFAPKFSFRTPLIFQEYHPLNQPPSDAKARAAEISKTAAAREAAAAAAENNSNGNANPEEVVEDVAGFYPLLFGILFMKEIDNDNDANIDPNPDNNPNPLPQN